MSFELSADGRCIPPGRQPGSRHGSARRAADDRPRPAVERAGGSRRRRCRSTRRLRLRGASWTPRRRGPRAGDRRRRSTRTSPARADDRNRGNRAVDDVFEPGSTSKVITRRRPWRRAWSDPRHRPGGARRHLAGAARSPRLPQPRVEQLTFAGVLAKSSNVGTILAAERVAKAACTRPAARFGLGSRPASGFPGSARHRAPARGLDRSQRYTVRSARASRLSARCRWPRVYATIANDGVRAAAAAGRATVDDGRRVRPRRSGDATAAWSARRPPRRSR